jgi:hypothetical protein
MEDLRYSDFSSPMNHLPTDSFIRLARDIGRRCGREKPFMAIGSKFRLRTIG